MAGRSTRRRARLTHVDAARRPRMVDVADKPLTARRALAECKVRFPAAAAAALRGAGLRSAKGPVLDTAIVAATLAVKRTHELIPFCHALPVQTIVVRGAFRDPRTLLLECEVAVQAQTGVEMEALVGVTVAALTVYDMCKALDHRIVIGPARLVMKRGGKRDVGRARR